MISEELQKKAGKVKIFKGLDVMRTFLALAVATGHYYWVNGIPTYYPRSFFLAVDFFFILSGFVLAQSIMYDKATNVGNFTFEFFAKRLVRLYPLYVVLAAVSFIAGACRGSVFYWYEYINSLLLMQGVGAAGPDFVAQKTFSIAWSISVELWAGLLFFPFVFLVRKNTKVLLWFCITIAIISWTLLFEYSPGYMDITIHRLNNVVAYGVFRGLLGFGLGTICYLASARSRITSKLAATLAECFLFAAYALLFCLPNYPRPLEFAAPIFLAAILFVLATERGLIGRALTSEKLAFSRPLSYSIYLFHTILIDTYRRQGIPFTNYGLPIFLCIVCLVAIALYRFIEFPSAQFGRGLLKRRTAIHQTKPTSAPITTIV